MLDIINPVIRFLLDNPAIFFAALGYVTGYLFRNTNPLIIIVAIVLIPYSLEWLVSLNWLWLATVPYLVFAVVGFIGHDKAFRYIGNLFYTLLDWVQRR